jgi:hypothetical protein
MKGHPMNKLIIAAALLISGAVYADEHNTAPTTPPATTTGAEVGHAAKAEGDKMAKMNTKEAMKACKSTKGDHEAHKKCMAEKTGKM